MKIAIYPRKSKYTEEGESIENQIEMCKNYIFSHIKNVQEEDISIYKDEGFSAKNTNRPQFQKMLSDAKKYHFDYIVCYRLDRISRSVSDFSSLIEELNLRQINFISIKEQFDTSAPMGRAMMYMASVFAQLERETIAERVRDNMIMLARTGRWLGGNPPTGFTSEKKTEIVVDDKIRTAYRLKENEDIKVIKLIYDKFLELGSINGVVTYLTNNGSKTINQNYYESKTIKQILTNPVYCAADKHSFNYFLQQGSDVCFEKRDCTGSFGIMPFNRHKNEINKRRTTKKSEWIIALGKHRGIIKGSDWVSVQNIIDKNGSEPTTYIKYALLSGLLTCQNCGNRMFAKIDKRRADPIRFYYVCFTKMRHKSVCCDNKNLPGTKTDDQVVDYIMNFDEENLIQSLNIKRFTRKVNKFKEKSEEINFEIADLNNKKNKYVAHLLKENPGSSFAKSIKSNVIKIDQEIEKLKSQKQIYGNQSDLANDEKDNLELIIKNLRFFKQNFHNLNFDDKKSLLRLVLKKLSWNGSKLDIILNGQNS